MKSKEKISQDEKFENNLITNKYFYPQSTFRKLAADQRLPQQSGVKEVVV